MSIDGVQFVTRIEDRFGVSISDEDVGDIETIGQLTSHLARRARAVRDRPCVAAWMFYRLRRVLLDALPLTKQQVRPAASLAELIPPAARRRVWRELQEEFDDRLPDLRMSATLRYGLLAFAAVSLVLMVAGTIIGRATEYLFVLPFIWALIVWVVLMIARLFFVRELPPETTTVAAAVRRVIPFQDLPPDQPAEALEPWLFENVRQVAAQAAGIEPSRLSRQTHFIRDLQMK